MRARILGCLMALSLGFHVSVVSADDASPPTLQQLLDPEWMETTLGARGIDSFIKLYEDHDDPLVQRLHDALILSRPFLSEHPEEFRSQMQARLLSSDEPELQLFQDLPADRVRARAMRASITQAGDALLHSFFVGRQAGHFVASTEGDIFAMHGARYVTTPAPMNLYGIEVRSGVTGELLRFVGSFKFHAMPAGISPDLTKLFGITEDGTFHAWDLASGELLWTGFCGFGANYRAWCSFSPDGQLVAVSNNAPQAVVFRIETGEQVAVIRVPRVNTIWQVAFLDNETLVGGAADGVMRHWDVATGAILEEFPVNAFRVSRDGTRAFTINFKIVDDDHFARDFEVFDAMTGELVRHVDFEEEIQLDAYEFDITGQYAIFSTRRPDRRLLAFDINTGAIAHDVPLRSDVALHFRSITGNQVMTSGMENLVQVWDLSRSRVPEEIPWGPRHVAITADGNTAMTADREEIQLWDTATWEVSASFALPEGAGLVDMSDDGQLIVYALGDEVHTIDVPTRQSSLAIDVNIDSVLRFHELHMSGDGQTVAVLGNNDKLYVFGREEGNLLGSTEGKQGFGISSDGTRILIRSRMFDVTTGEVTESERFRNWHSAISADGQFGISWMRVIGSFVWNVDSSEVVKDAAYSAGIEFNQNSQLLGALSADGRYSISCSNDFNVYLYDTQAGEQLAVVSVDGLRITDFAFSADGGDLLIATRYGTWHHYRFENLPP